MQKITGVHNIGSTVSVQLNKNMNYSFFSFPYQATPFSALPAYPCKSQCVFLWGVYRAGIMKSLRESEAAGVNTRQGILSISHHEPWCLGSLFLRLSPWIIKMLSHIKKYNAMYGRTINTASKLITFPLRRIIYFAALGPQRSHLPLLLSHLVDEWAM